MTKQQFEKHMEQIVQQIQAMPADQQGPLLQIVEETRRRQADTSAQCERARHALDDWRIMQKYLIFDAEATLRESRGQ